MISALLGSAHPLVASRQFSLALLLAAAISGTGCAVTGGGIPTRADMRVLKSDENFELVSLKSGQTIDDVARVFLGDEREAWQLYELNGSLEDTTGELIAVPRSPVNVTGVYQSFYRTVPILCYHQFTDAKKAEHRLELAARDFEDQLRYLVAEGYQFLSFAEVEQILAQERTIPAKSVVLTIDDGYASVYDIAWPLLKKYRAKATLFVYTDFVGGGAAMSWAQLRELQASDLIEVESHGKSHHSLARVKEDPDRKSYVKRLKEELEGSEAVFARRLGQTPTFMSYPYGNSSETIAQMLSTDGYKLAATVTRGPNGSFVDPFLLHRTMIFSDHSLDQFATFLVTEQPRR